jgi:alpha-ketoglutarate-dependent taurine dioxygenase
MLAEGLTLPLVVEPVEAGLDLVKWAAQYVGAIEEAVLVHGAVLFRGFDVQTPEQFNDVARAICSTLYSDNAEHPRESLGGDVYTPVFYAPEKKLLWHNENTFNQSWPLRMWFYAHRPAATGGETPIVDSRRVFERLDPALRAPFEEKGVMYLRNYRKGLGLDWQTVFQTTDRAVAEAKCQSEGFTPEWLPDGRLRTRCVRPAAVRHPATGEMAWVTQAQHWHPSMLDAQTHSALTMMFKDEDLPRNCYYGDGSKIDPAVMQAICDVYQELEVSFPWQRGDVVMLDNLLTAHARTAFTGERKLCVAMGELFTPGT